MNVLAGLSRVANYFVRKPVAGNDPSAPRHPFGPASVIAPPIEADRPSRRSPKHCRQGD